MAAVNYGFSYDFLKTLRELPKPVHSKLVKCLDQIASNPANPGLNLESLSGKTDGLVSARVDLDYRLILKIFERYEGRTDQLLFVGKHEDAYRFANKVQPEAEPIVVEEFVVRESPAGYGSSTMEDPTTSSVQNPISLRTKKYLALPEFLFGQDETIADVRMTFQQIESVLGMRLPGSARKYSAWWSNDFGTHSHASAWMALDWRTKNVSVTQESVTFFRSS